MIAPSDVFLHYTLSNPIRPHAVCPGPFYVAGRAGDRAVLLKRLVPLLKTVCQSTLLKAARWAPAAIHALHGTAAKDEAGGGAASEQVWEHELQVQTEPKSPVDPGGWQAQGASGTEGTFCIRHASLGCTEYDGCEPSRASAHVCDHVAPTRDGQHAFHRRTTFQPTLSTPSQQRRGLDPYISCGTIDGKTGGTDQV